jgi:hypothetical protein
MFFLLKLEGVNKELGRAVILRLYDATSKCNCIDRVVKNQVRFEWELGGATGEPEHVPHRLHRGGQGARGPGVGGRVVPGPVRWESESVACDYDNEKEKEKEFPSVINGVLVL